MRYKIPDWIKFSEEQEERKILTCTECPVKKQLKELIARYHEDKKEFICREEFLISQFGLTKDEHRFIHFGIISPSNIVYKKYIDILNNDLYLNKLSADIKDVLLEGNLLIVQALKKKEIYPIGYEIDHFIKFPELYCEETYNLVQSLWGYEHIHQVNGLLMFELAARVYITEYPEILELVDLWIDGLGVFI